MAAPTPTKDLPMLSDIHQAELRRLGATLSLAYGGSQDSGHILLDRLSRFSDTRQERIKSRRQLVAAARETNEQPRRTKHSL